MMIKSDEFLERLKRMKDNVYMGGKLIKRDDPQLMPGVRVIMLSYDLAVHPEFKGLFTATSHLDAKKINRFTHIHQNADDLIKKIDMTREGIHQTGFCIQRCMGIDAMNALSVVTKEVDDAKDTEYHQKFIEYLKYWQENDISGACAQTDVKGNRKLRPHEQPDPDHYVRIVERKKDGIIVRGAKSHITMAAYADEIIVIPTRMLTKEEGDWAVAFGIPADAKGVKLVNRASAPRARKYLTSPLTDFGSSDSFILFDDVFVPLERVFLAGETEFAGRLALMFALYHRHSYCGCKPGVTDILMGLTALVAEYHGLEKAQHIQHKIADLIGVGELVYASGIAAAVRSEKASSGTQIPNTIFANVGRRHAGENIYHEHSILADVSGGISATLPFEEDFFAEETKDLLHKYIIHNDQVPAENQHRCYRTIGDLICSGFGGVWQIAGVHGGGSPIMESIALLGNYDLSKRKKLAKHIAGIKD
jgi:4-hydroxyphenylacetate 3-monooxygenase/4-hydroxybutyryl-CoA dehydratase/vinylacetyl-CoA-Delta-isomerase